MLFNRLLRRGESRSIKIDGDPRPPGDLIWDVVCLAGCLLMGCWLMYATLGYYDGSFKFAIKSWSDFGANLSLSQSLALGNNYPTEHPFFPGEAIRYHFLFWFQAANLSYLGLNLVTSVNVLSLLSLAAVLVMVTTMAETIFNTRVIGRIAAVLFFFASTSLSYIPFLRAQPDFGSALQAVGGLKDYLPSGYPYRGEGWGGLTVAVYSNQRHLISAAGLLLIVVVYLVSFYRKKGVFPVIDADVANPDQTTADAPGNRSTSRDKLRLFRFGPDIKPIILCGIIVGLLPYWNGAVFVSALIVLGGLFLFFSFRQYLFVLLATACLVGIPQVMLLTGGSASQTSYSLFTPGYTITNPTLPLVLQYIGWTFGFKLILLAIAVYFVPGPHRRVLAAFTLLVPVVFLTQLSTDAFNNHKLLNMWNVLTSSYEAYAIWMIGRRNLVHAGLATILTVVTVFGSVIDLFPIRNDGWIVVPHENDRLTAWLLATTEPSDIFLTDTLLSHPILFTGRKIYLGNTLFAWSAGYDLKEREETYRRLFSMRDANMLLKTLRDNNIEYVAIDDGVRNNKSIRNLNESVFRESFDRIFEDTDNKHGHLDIYRVPGQPP
ncbi:MAG: hypothetical protein ABR530_03120 [Pyrinomonadaceae bacterium]